MDDQLLVQQVLNGSESAFRLLMSRYERLIIHMVGRVVSEQMDREELVQDVFMKIYEKLHSFNFDSKLSTWIATVAFRTAVNFTKRKKLNLQDLDQVKYEGVDDNHLTEEVDYRAFIRKMIDKLPVHYKLVLTLFYIEGFSYPEIMEITEMPEGTVKNYLFRAKSKLKSLLEKENEIELMR